MRDTIEHETALDCVRAAIAGARDEYPGELIGVICTPLLMRNLCAEIGTGDVRWLDGSPLAVGRLTTFADDGERIALCSATTIRTLPNGYDQVQDDDGAFGFRVLETRVSVRNRAWTREQAIAAAWEHASQVGASPAVRRDT